jgi:ATP-dependent Clp protease ATP-binding subunit ClpA
VTEESIRSHIDQGRKREKVSTTVDMPVSRRLKRVLAFCAEEAERAGSRPIRPDHLLLGLAREEESLAAGILMRAGLTAVDLREFSVSRAPSDPGRRDVQQVIGTLASVVPPGESVWVASLAAWLARSSDKDIEALIAAIRRC